MRELSDAEETRNQLPASAPLSARSPAHSPAPFADRVTFERQVRDALAHLHEPGHLQTHPLTRFLPAEAGSRPSSLGRALRQAIVEGVESLRPDPRHSPSTRAWRRHEVLRLRYVEGLEVSQVLDRLSLSKSVYYLEQQRAVEALSAVLIERWGLDAPSDASSDGPREERGGQSGRVGEGGEVLAAAEARLAREEAAPREVSGNLPIQLTSFVGRESEIAEVKRLLGTTRLLTLTGSGGCGKTRLALEVAAELLGEYEDGIYLVEFAAIADSDLVPSTAALVLGVREVSGEPILSTLLAYLEAKRLLLVLDNCEHLVDASAKLADSLLRACPKLAILATSREGLGIGGESVWPVPSLAVPPESGASLEDLGQNESVRLFADRARALRPSFTLTERSAPSVARICRLLSGMPLAIELAAARVSVLSPEQIVERLGGQLELLTGGSRTALPRQQTLRATLDWSYDLLSEPEREVLRRLAVFVGGFTLEAAEAICSGEKVEGRQVLDLLSQLVDKSVVQVETEGSEARYWLLEPIRQYARDRLEAAAEWDAIQARHRDWYLELAKEAESGIDGADRRTWLDRLETEHGNLRAALDWCLVRDGDAVLGLRLAASLGQFWRLRGYLSEGRRWLETMLGRAVGWSALRAKALEQAGFLARDQSDFGSATVWFAESLGIYRQVGDKRGIASVLNTWSAIVDAEGDPSRAEELVEESLVLYREVGDAWGIQRALGNLGALAVNRGNPERARPLLEEAIRRAEKLGAKSPIAWHTANLAKVARSGGDTERAREHFERSLALFREMGQRQQEASVLVDLARLAVGHGEHARAAVLMSESLEIVQDVVDRDIISRCLCLSAVIASKQNKAERAARLAGATVALWGPSTNLRLAEGTDYERELATSRVALGAEAFSQAWSEGQAMTLEQALEYALQDEPGV